MYTFVSGLLAKIIIKLLYNLVLQDKDKVKKGTGNQENIPILLGISK